VLSSLLVFINAHLAINHANQVAVLAAHVDRVSWLYPTPKPTSNSPHQHDQRSNGHVNGLGQSSTNANKYPPFLAVEQQVMSNLRALMSSTSPEAVSTSNPPLLSGAISIALAFSNMQTLLSSPVANDTSAGLMNAPGASTLDAHTNAIRSSMQSASESLVSRVFILSVSAADLSTQYIGLMNSIFAAQRMRIPIDILRIGKSTAFLQQASDATGGVFLAHSLSRRSNYRNPHEPRDPRNGHGPGVDPSTTGNTAAAGLLQTLMMAYLPDTTARRALVSPGTAEVDFRAACFCHGKVVDLGGVCSVCLSIFCIPLPSENCLTCGTLLRMPKGYGVKPAVLPKKKKKKKKAGGGGGDGGRDTPGVGSGSATPAV
jgi:transcription initiation factor TFIIH subunit 3